MRNDRRKGEKRGWLLGWLGAFLWVLVLSIVALVQGLLISSLIGFILVLTGVAAVFILSPWRHPSQRYWKLMVPIYLVFFFAVAWAMWFAGGPTPLGITPWSLFLLLPLLLPFLMLGERRWTDGEQMAP